MACPRMDQGSTITCTDAARVHGCIAGGLARSEGSSGYVLGASPDIALCDPYVNHRMADGSSAWVWPQDHGTTPTSSGRGRWNG